MEQPTRSNFGDIELLTSPEEYNITQTSSTEDHVTYLARDKYAADRSMRDEDDDTTGVNVEKDWAEHEQLKKAYEEIMKKKEQIDELVERQQLALKEQERTLDNVMQKEKAEHDGMENVAGEFADKMKTYTHFKEETTNRRLYHKEIEIQADMLNKENEELAQDISELVVHINEIEERRHIGLKSLKEKTKEMLCAAEQMKDDVDRIESDINQKIEDLSNFRMELNDRGIPYVRERKLVQVNGMKTKKPFPFLENPLKIDIENLNEPLPTTDTARHETSPKKVLEQVTFTCNKEIKKQVAEKADYSPRLNEGSGDETRSCNDMGSEKVQDLNKDVDDSEKKVLETKSEFVSVSSDLDTLLAHESFVEDNEKDDDINVTRISKCFESQSMGDKNKVTHNDNTSQEKIPETLGFENNVIEIDTDKSYKEMLKPTTQLSARMPGKRDKKTKFTKPAFHPYGSTERDGDRHVVSKKSTSVFVLRNDNDRKRYVPENQRNTFEEVVGHISAESENQLPIKYNSPFAHKTEKITRSPAIIEQQATKTKNKTGTPNRIRNGEIKSSINTGRQNIEISAKDSNQSLKKRSKTKKRVENTELFNSQKSEIKPRNDTRLNAVKQKLTNPVQQKPKQPNQYKSKSEYHVQKDSTDTVKQVKHARSKSEIPTKPAVSRREPKLKQLPALKMIRKESDMGKTVEDSCNNGVTLPQIKPPRKCEEHKLSCTRTSIDIPDKQKQARCSLPPIGRSPTTRHGLDNKVMESDHLTSLNGMADSFLPLSVPSKRLSPLIATSSTEQKLHHEPEVIPLSRKPVSNKSNEHVQKEEQAMAWPLFSPSPPQSPPPNSRRSHKLGNLPILDNSPTISPSPPQSPPLKSRRSRKLGNMPILANSPTIDLDRKPHLKA